jgi:hypothetical protein
MSKLIIDKEYDFYYFLPVSNCVIALVYRKDEENQPRVIHKVCRLNFPILPYLLSKNIKVYISDDIDYHINEYIENEPIPLSTYRYIARAYVDYNNNKKAYFINKEEKLISFNVDNKVSFAQLLSFTNNKKSLKKTIYKRYEYFTKKYGYYNYTFDVYILKNFKDVNFISAILNHHILFDISQIFCYQLEYLCTTLSKFYTPKQIKNFLISIDDSFIDTFKNTIYTIHNSPNLKIQNKLTLNKHNFTSIIRQLYCIDRSITFKYPLKVLRLQKRYNHYTFRFPRNILELFKYASKLRNCLKQNIYTNNILSNSAYIIGVYINAQIKYAIEIQDNKLINFLGRNNKQPLKKDKKNILKILQQNGIKLPKKTKNR